MRTHELKVLLHSMITCTDRDGFTREDFADNACDMVDAARRCGYISEQEHRDLYQWMNETF